MGRAGVAASECDRPWFACYSVHITTYDDDGSRELGELELLQLPRGAVVADKVRELGLEPWVAVGWEHLTVGVHVDALASCLLQDGLQVTHVVAGDEDALALHLGVVHRRRHRRAVAVCVTRVKDLQRLQVGTACAQRQAQQVVNGCLALRQLREGLVDERVHLIGLLAQLVGVGGVGSCALQAVPDDDAGAQVRVLAHTTRT